MEEVGERDWLGAVKPGSNDEFRVLLKRAGFSQGGFAAHIRVHLKTVSRWAMGQARVPRVVVMYLEMRLAAGERDV